MTVIRLIARPLLASMFVVGGINALRNPTAMAAKAQPITDKIVPLARKAVPAAPIPTDATTLVRINAATQVVSGLALATGRMPRVASTVLALSLMPTTVAGHRFWEEIDPVVKANQQTHFFKNLSMLGGVLLAGVDTEGRPGLAWRAQRAAKDVRREAGKLQKTARREAKLAKSSLT